MDKIRSIKPENWNYLLSFEMTNAGRYGCGFSFHPSRSRTSIESIESQDQLMELVESGVAPA